jgi:hypothetical protein
MIADQDIYGPVLIGRHGDDSALRLARIGAALPPGLSL